MEFTYIVIAALVVFALSLLICLLVVKSMLQKETASLIALQKAELEAFQKGIDSSMDALAESVRTTGALSRELVRDKMESVEKGQRDFAVLTAQRMDREARSSEEKLEAMRRQIGESVESLRVNVSEKLEIIRTTVDEKLEKTLSERLGKSFDAVGRQLVEVQKGLGEMQTLAQDVGGLKRVLSNVKMRGGLGEVQLSMLLEQILAPGQYEANVHVRPRSAQVVEFAVKLPGSSDSQSQLWLPIDAKFPREAYERLQAAYDAADAAAVEAERKALYQEIRRMAADIRDKYIAPPYTTDFAIMFLPFEGIYSEVVRSATLLQELQSDYKVNVAGPATLAAFLNSLQMGFRTLAIQKRSSQVWKVLSGVKKEFENFGALLEKVQGQLQGSLNTIDDLRGVRTRKIEARLRGVESGQEEHMLSEAEHVR